MLTDNITSQCLDLIISTTLLNHNYQAMILYKLKQFDTISIITMFTQYTIKCNVFLLNVSNTFPAK